MRGETMRKSRTPQAPARFRIEGCFVTYIEIAARLGITKGAAESRMKRLRGASGAVTWSRLGEMSKSEAA